MYTSTTLPSHPVCTTPSIVWRDEKKDVLKCSLVVRYPSPIKPLFHPDFWQPTYPLLLVITSFLYIRLLSKVHFVQQSIDKL